ncbi:MAG: 1-deoxy-D-xylulose-5-phosphate reductoisomerase [Defluviitaleaceae bacterium]|nr:1-deoxy-D-xylulose-5-phosphate reductoisomerase [Defluviitaleaceae bacterium]
MAQRISILGSTGSIGVQTLGVADNLGATVAALTAHSNIDLLEQQARKYRPEIVAVMDIPSAVELRKRLAGSGITVEQGIEGVIAAAAVSSADIVVNALVGGIGIRPTVAAIEAGKDIALANKETLVAAGEAITRLATERKVAIRPIDSEHSAIFQCLQGSHTADAVEKIYLTASGGPFRGKSREMLENVTPSDALKHPNWDMGAKITIDSATMMNKGLEVIEAKWLFGIDLDRISVLVHPQSIIHSMVEFRDGAVMAQLGEPDMRVPISYALTYPDRARTDFPRIDFLKSNSLTFEKPDLDAFPCLRLAYEAAKAGGCLPAVMNAANEAAVGLFLENKISFLRIPLLIEKAMGAYTLKDAPDIAAVLAADEWGREEVYRCQ